MFVTQSTPNFVASRGAVGFGDNAARVVSARKKFYFVKVFSCIGRCYVYNHGMAFGWAGRRNSTLEKMESKNGESKLGRSKPNCNPRKVPFNHEAQRGWKHCVPYRSDASVHQAPDPEKSERGERAPGNLDRG